jgi:hypothetical protein
MKYLEYNLIAMKKFIFLLFAAVLLASCHDEPTMRLDPEAMISIKPDPSGWNNAMSLKSAEHLSALEIVKQGNCMRFYNDHLSNNDCAAGFAGKDTTSETPAFLRYGTDIINLDGFGNPYMSTEFICAYDCVIEIFRSNHDIDTIAYIPNSVLRKAEADVLAALEAKDTTAVYSIFNNAFQFLPITGAEYRELKKQGLQ